jgi:hypothetical protein
MERALIESSGVPGNLSDPGRGPGTPRPHRCKCAEHDEFESSG